jgi:hypothetical protein
MSDYLSSLLARYLPFETDFTQSAVYPRPQTRFETPPVGSGFLPVEERSTPAEQISGKTFEFEDKDDPDKLEKKNQTNVPLFEPSQSSALSPAPEFPAPPNVPIRLSEQLQPDTSMIQRNDPPASSLSSRRTKNLGRTTRGMHNKIENVTSEQVNLTIVERGIKSQEQAPVPEQPASGQVKPGNNASISHSRSPLPNPVLFSKEFSQTISDEKEAAAILPRPLPQISLPQVSKTTEPASSITVSIGRIEVRASLSGLSAPAAKPRNMQPVMSLEEYLQQRKNGGGR